MNELAEMLNPRVGKVNKPYMLQWLGFPVRCEYLGSRGEMCLFRKSYGLQTTGYAGVYANQYAGYGYGVGATWEAYDELTIIFDENGTMVDWRAYVQR